MNDLTDANETLYGCASLLLILSPVIVWFSVTFSVSARLGTVAATALLWLLLVILLLAAVAASPRPSSPRQSSRLRRAVLASVIWTLLVLMAAATAGGPCLAWLKIVGYVSDRPGVGAPVTDVKVQGPCRGTDSSWSSFVWGEDIVCDHASWPAGQPTIRGTLHGTNGETSAVHSTFSTVITAHVVGNNAYTASLSKPLASTAQLNKTFPAWTLLGLLFPLAGIPLLYMVPWFRRSKPERSTDIDRVESPSPPGPQPAPGTAADPPSHGGKSATSRQNQPSALPAGTQITETVAAALRAAVDGQPFGGPVDTRTLLLALMDAHDGEWHRVWLESGDPTWLRGLLTEDPDPGPGGSWTYICLTVTCTAALQIAAEITRRWNLRTLGPGALALGLVADPRSAASRALTDGGLSHDALLDLLQRTILGVTLRGLGQYLPEMVRAHQGTPS
ncbi:hypothetical protein [Frankia sp. CiP3]|uniref:hypothetical protein n=1 Tax=Frankia sp. CiP3 TaxID=2880971 RepID=UPI001EF57385|nr:hypothetical protein [Frankia sp. CiP3]